MQNFDWTTFTQRIMINATPEKIYSAWSQSGELEKWFLSSAVYKTNSGEVKPADASALPGDIYNWQWFMYDLEETGKVVTADGKNHFAFSFAGSCRVEIHLERVDEMVRLELTQSNIPTDDVSKKDIRLGCASGWAFFLVNLKSVLEGGLDLREKDRRFVKPLLNC